MLISAVKLVLHLIKYAVLLFSSFIGLLMLSNCTMMGLNYASLETDNKPAAHPPIAATTKASWEAGRPGLQAQFEDIVYGPWPAGLPAEIVSRRVVVEDYLGGRGKLEEVIIKLGKSEDAPRFLLGLATPNSPNAPLIISQTFSSTCAVFMEPQLNKSDGTPCGKVSVPGIVENIFGPYIATAPVDQYLDAGYAYASYFAGDVVPDRSRAAPAALARLNDGAATPTSAITAWAYAYSAVIDVLENDPGIDAGRIAVLGHSRHGKAALVAGAFEPRISAVLAHQSGYGGAASSRATVGEGINKMVNGARVLPLLPKLAGYPHWFAPEFQAYTDRLDELPVDQHQLIALNAPTPVFLGNARRDVWSDPNSTFRMAEAADTVYELYGLSGLDQAGMDSFNPAAEIAFFMRRGGHGVHQSDIDAFLAFLDQHLAPAAD